MSFVYMKNNIFLFTYKKPVVVDYVLLVNYMFFST
jgi:hypothetical protein